MNFLRRALNILVRPRSEWRIIKAERTSTAALFFSYILAICGIQLLANLALSAQPFAGSAGPKLLGLFTWRDLVLALLAFIENIINIFVFGAILNAICSRFIDQTGRTAGYKIAAYASTVLVIPILFLAAPTWFFKAVAIASIVYFIYLVYLAVVIVMDIPGKPAAWYASGSLAAAIAALWIVDSAFDRFIDYVNTALNGAAHGMH